MTKNKYSKDEVEKYINAPGGHGQGRDEIDMGSAFNPKDKSDVDDSEELADSDQSSDDSPKESQKMKESFVGLPEDEEILNPQVAPDESTSQSDLQSNSDNKSQSEIKPESPEPHFGMDQFDDIDKNDLQSSQENSDFDDLLKSNSGRSDTTGSNHQGSDLPSFNDKEDSSDKKSTAHKNAVDDSQEDKTKSRSFASIKSAPVRAVSKMSMTFGEVKPAEKKQTKKQSIDINKGAIKSEEKKSQDAMQNNASDDLSLDTPAGRRKRRRNARSKVSDKTPAVKESVEVAALPVEQEQSSQMLSEDVEDTNGKMVEAESHLGEHAANDHEVNKSSAAKERKSKDRKRKAKGPSGPQGPNDDGEKFDGAQPFFLRNAMRAAKKSFIFVGVLSFFTNLLMLTMPLYMLQIFDRVLSSGRTETLMYLTIIAIFALVVFGVLDLLRSYILLEIGNWFDKTVGPSALSSCPRELLNGNNYGAQCIKDLGEVRSFIGGTKIQAFFDAPWSIIYLGVLFLLHVSIGILGVVGAIVLFVFAILNERTMRARTQEFTQLSFASQSKIQSSLRNADAVQAMGMMPALIDQWQPQHETMLNEQAHSMRYFAFFVAISKWWRFCLQVAVFGLGAYYVLQGTMTPGMMIVGSMLLSRGLSPIERSLGSWQGLVGFQQSYRRLKQHCSQVKSEQVQVKLPKPKGQVTAQNIIFIPPGLKSPVIKQASFNIEVGETVAILGPVGAGKSTLIRLLMGSFPVTAGEIRIDDSLISAWDNDRLGKFIGYCPQDLQLLPGTIAQNIARMQADPPSKDVMEAAKLAQVHELIAELPQGYDTVIGEKQVQLSRGQLQRLAFARAVYGDPNIIAFDEPISHLDAEGERAFVIMIQALKNMGKTIFIVSHRFSILDLADKVISLSDGRVQYFGDRAEMVAHQTASQISPTAQINPGQKKPRGEGGARG